MQAWLHRTRMQGVTLRDQKSRPCTGEGENWARGENVMKGYYATGNDREVLTPDGWFRTVISSG